MTPEEQLAELVKQGVSQAVLNAFRRANGLPVAEAAPVPVVVRAVTLPARRSRKAPSVKPTKPQPVGGSILQTQDLVAKGRFDLLEFEDSNE